ncbi:T4S1 protein, partial [Turnix velox]|nr:T4S1 protein [Turnix velox]
LPLLLHRVAMCVGKCSRILGPCLLVLGMLSMAANVLLLFPGGSSKYLAEARITYHAKIMPGVWGGGITVSTLVVPTGVFFLECPCVEQGGGMSAWWLPFICQCLLALLGATACFVLSGVGLTNGPLCFYNSSEHGTLWGYPFLDADSQEPDDRTGNYLYNRGTWSTCLEPAGIVAWNVTFFSLLLLISAAEMVLASIQILNGLLGCLCGFCEGK